MSLEQLEANKAVLPGILEDHPPPLGQPLTVHVVDIDRSFAFRTQSTLAAMEATTASPLYFVCGTK